MELSPGQFVMKKYDGFDRKGQEVTEQQKQVLDRIWNNLDNKSVREEYVQDELVMLFNTGNYYPEVFKFLSTKEDFTKVKKFTGRCLDMYFYARSLNAIRDILKNPETPPNEQETLQKLGRVMLGDDPEKPGNFFTSLSDLYNDIKFEEYKPNEKATRQDVELLDRAVENINDGVVVDLGCGTGRLITELAKQKSEGKISNDIKLIGMDSQERHVEITQSNMSEIGDRNSEVIQGSWYEIPLEDNSVDVLYCLGRSLPHVEDNENIKVVIDEVYRVLKPGGIFIFDVPDPHTGAYRKARRRIESALRMLGKSAFDIRRAMYESNTFIVDGPDETRSYNRFAPEITEVKEIVGRGCHIEAMDDVYNRLEYYGAFEVSEVGRVKILGSRGAESVYMVAYKPGHADLDPDLDAQITHVEQIKPEEEGFDMAADDMHFHAQRHAKDKLKAIAYAKMKEISGNLKQAFKTNK